MSVEASYRLALQRIVERDWSSQQDYSQTVAGDALDGKVPGFRALCILAREILDTVYPADVFGGPDQEPPRVVDGVDRGSGPVLVQMLRALLDEIEERP